MIARSRVAALCCGILLLGLGASGCKPAARQQRSVVGTFVARVDPRAGTITFQQPEGGFGAQAVIAADRDGTEGTGAADHVELVTRPGTIRATSAAGVLTNGGCGRPSSWCADVTVRSFYATSELHNVYVELTQITPASANLGFASTKPPASSSTAVTDTYGLWGYPALLPSSYQATAPSVDGPNAATRTWRFDDYTGAAFYVTGRVVADVVARSGTAAANQVSCGATPADTAIDTASNCGECGRACPAGATCAWPRAYDASTPPCACGVGQTFCDSRPSGGVCADLLTDAANCGACGNVCSGSTATCSNGRCVAGRNVLVVSPHPEDATLIAGYRIKAALANGDNVKVVFVTSGDAGTWTDSSTTPATSYSGESMGTLRQGEAVAAMAQLGLPESSVIFMGYPQDILRTIFNTQWPGNAAPDGTLTGTTSDVWTSPTTSRTTTYATRGLGGTDWHTYRTGSPAPYSRDAMVADLQDLFTQLSPSEVYTTTTVDGRDDHQAVAMMLTEVLVGLKRAPGGSSLATKIYQGMAYMQGCGTVHWPVMAGTLTGFTSRFAMEEPGCLANPPAMPAMPLQWDQAIRFPSPKEYAYPGNAKALAAANYRSLLADGAFLFSHARRDEPFFLNDLGTNVAISATPTASQEDVAGIENSSAWKAINGVWNGSHHNEWLTVSELADAWVQLDWATPMTVSAVVLHAPADASRNVNAGRLDFSDGTSITVASPLPTNSRGVPFTFAPKTVTWVRFTITAADGSSGKTGLGEIEVFGGPATALPAPRIVSGPTPASTSIAAGASTTVTVQASGDATAYDWFADDGGTITGSGNSVTFTAPTALSDPTTYRVRAVVSNAHGSTTNWAYVLVTSDATATASSARAESPASGALDGFVDGWPNDRSREWATVDGTGATAHMDVTWPYDVTITGVILYDRITDLFNVTIGTLTFFDAGNNLLHTETVGALPTTGLPLTVNLTGGPLAGVRSVVFTVDSCNFGNETGLAELEVF